MQPTPEEIQATLRFLSSFIAVGDYSDRKKTLRFKMMAAYHALNESDETYTSEDFRLAVCNYANAVALEYHNADEHFKSYFSKDFVMSLDERVAQTRREVALARSVRKYD